MSTGAANHRGSSKQDYRTPDDFRTAVVARFGQPSFDLAADSTNRFSESNGYFGEEGDSLKENWSMVDGLLYLNPPFSNITPWAKKCAEESAKGARILFLTPASVGSNWFQDYVHGKAMVYFLNPRLCFDPLKPKDGFPKDCILSVFDGGKIGYEPWKWKP